MTLGGEKLNRGSASWELPRMVVPSEPLGTQGTRLGRLLCEQEIDGQWKWAALHSLLPWPPPAFRSKSEQVPLLGWRALSRPLSWLVCSVNRIVISKVQIRICFRLIWAFCPQVLKHNRRTLSVLTLL